MTAPLRLNADQLDQVAASLRILTQMRATTTVEIDPHTYPQLCIGDASLRIRWDDESEQYVIDDRNGD